MTTVEREESSRRRPGPRRPAGRPTGPDEVRWAVCDQAGRLFAERGVESVSLRDIASAAEVQLSLIRRYVGSRSELIDAVFVDLTTRLAQDVVDHPLQQHGFDRDSTMGRWTVLVTYFAVSGKKPPSDVPFNPVQALADVIESVYGLTPEAARLRGAQITASALGWRIFEDLLIGWADLPDVDAQELQDELTRTHRRLGATPWPSPEDPTPRGR